MAIIAEYKAACGATVRIADDCFWPESERAWRKAQADRVLLEIYAEAYLEKQRQCAAEYERRAKANGSGEGD